MQGDGARGLSRRGFLRAGIVVAPLAAAGCSGAGSSAGALRPPAAALLSSTPPAAAVELVHATSGRPEVALTFHGAGDRELARKILTTLHARGVRATVLAVGTWLVQYPDVARMATDLGHEVGNHTWSHTDLAALDEAGVRAEIERCRDRLAVLIGGPGAFFRPSAAQHATERVRRLAGAAGYPRVLSYDVDSRDFTDPGAASVRRNVAAAVAGSVVSLHLGHLGTLAALPGLLDDLAARGLTPVTGRRLFD